MRLAPHEHEDLLQDLCLWACETDNRGPEDIRWDRTWEMKFRLLCLKIRELNRGRMRRVDHRFVAKDDVDQLVPPRQIQDVLRAERKSLFYQSVEASIIMGHQGPGTSTKKEELKRAVLAREQSFLQGKPAESNKDLARRCQVHPKTVDRYSTKARLPYLLTFIKMVRENSGLSREEIKNLIRATMKEVWPKWQPILPW
jgi:hypothetical protein